MNSEPTTDQSHVKQWINKMSDVRSLLTDVTLVVFISFAIFIVIIIAFKEIPGEKVVIDLIEVPETPKDGLPENGLPGGYTKLTLTRQLLDNAQKISEKLQNPIFDSLDVSYSLARLSSTSKIRSIECQNQESTPEIKSPTKGSKKKSSTDCKIAYIDKDQGSKIEIPTPHPLRPDWDEPDIEVPGIQLSLKSLKRFLRQAFGVPETHITGEITVTKNPITAGITKESNVIHLNLRSNSSKDFQPDPVMEGDINEVLAKGGMNLLELTQPCTLASYSYNHQLEMEDEYFNKLIDACLNDSPELAFYGNLLLGQKAVQQQNFVEAIKQFSKAIQINIESSDAPNWWLALFAQDKLNEINGRSADAYYNWGRALLEQDKPNEDEAIDKFNKALEALKQIEKNIDKLNPKQQADIYLLWGNLLLNIASITNDSAIRDEAFKKFEKVSDLDKQKGATAFVLWGNALLDSRAINEAIDKYQKAAELQPNYLIAYKNWGLALYEQGKFTEAIAKYKEATDKQFEKVANGIDKQKGATAFVLWGNALLDLRAIDEAIDKYQKATELQPDYTIAYNNWGKALYEQGKVAEAIAKYKEATDKNPEYVEAYYNLGLAYMQIGKIPDANTLFKKVIDNDKNHKFKNVYYPYAITLVTLGKPEEAIPYYEKAQELFPESADFYFDWGIALARAAKKDKQKLDEAIEQFKKAICIDQTYFRGYYNYGSALQIQGRYADAIMLYQKALETDKEKILFNKSTQKIEIARSEMETSKQNQAAATDESLLKCTSTKNSVERQTSEDVSAESESDSQAPIIPKMMIWSVTGGITALSIGLLVIFFKRKPILPIEPSTPEPQFTITPLTKTEEKKLAPRRLTQVEEYIPTSEHQQTAILLCVAGTLQSQKFPVEKAIYNIGANSQNDLCIPDDEYVSGHHAYLKHEKGSLLIFDPGSRNGTFVNGQRLSATACVLKPGDRIQIGKESFEVLIA